MDQRYLSAFLSLKAHKVGGRVLRPFCIRHRLTLEAIGSPCLPGSERPITRADLLLALRVCSMDDPHTATARGGFKDAITMLLWKYWLPSYARALRGWVNYLEDCANQPRIGTARQAGGKNRSRKTGRGLDWTLAVVVGLMDLGFTEEEAWTMPEGRALHYYFAYAIRGGADLDFWTTDDEEALPRMKAALQADIEKVKALVASGKMPPPTPAKKGVRARPFWNRGRK